jgi:methionine-gamma-lyase
MKNTTMSPESYMMSLGYSAKEHQGAVKSPIFQTSTFAFRSAEEGKAFFEIAYGLREKKEGEKLGMIYSRVDNPNMHILEQRLAVWDNAEAGAFFSSGMAAITTTVFTFVRPGDLFVYASPVYGGTDHFFNHVLPQFGIKVVKFFPGDSELDILKKIEHEAPGMKPAMIYVETPGNPVNSLIDLDMVRDMASGFSTFEKDCLMVVDNTFLGPVFQHPMKFGADLVVYSATKFIGGHSDVIAGACVGNNTLISQLKAMRTFFGSQLDPNSSWLLMRSLETLKIRMEQQTGNAVEIAQYLKSHHMVEELHYLGNLEKGSEQERIYQKQCEASGSMIAFNIKGGEKEAFTFLNNLEMFKLAVSLGSTESLAEHPATMTHVDVAPEDRERLGISPNLIRLSIGLEDAGDLILKIEKAFEKAEEVYSGNNKLEHSY